MLHRHRSLNLKVLTASLIVAGTLVASPSSAQGSPDDVVTGASAKKTLLIMNFQVKGDVDRGIASTISDILASAMVKNGRFKVMTGDDIRSLMALEAGKQNAGCETDSCLAEIAGALGADLVVTGRVGRLGTLYVTKLSLIEPSTASTLGLETLEAESVETFAKRIPPLATRFTAAAYGETVDDTPPPEDKSVPDPAPTTEAEPVTDDGGFGLGSMLLIGGSVIGGGALVAAVAAGAGATIAFVTVNTPSADGGSKATMRDFGPLLASSAVAAATIAVIGGGIAASGLFIE